MLGVDDYPHPDCACGPDVPPCLYGQGQCTDGAQWRMLHDLGFRCTQWHDARLWAQTAAAEGVLVDQNPTRGAILQMDAGAAGGQAGSFGHVAVVLCEGPCTLPNGVVCAGGSVGVEDWNSRNDCCYHQHCIPFPAVGVHVIHPGTPPPPPPPPPSPCPPGYQLIDGTCAQVVGPPILRCPPGYVQTDAGCVSPVLAPASHTGIALVALALAAAGALLLWSDYSGPRGLEDRVDDLLHRARQGGEEAAYG